jgi:hypothetical protein
MTEREQKIGLTFAQILSLIGVCAMVMAAWISLNVKIAENTVRIEVLERGRVENANNIEKSRVENKTDHQYIIEKLDELIYDLKLK